MTEEIIVCPYDPKHSTTKSKYWTHVNHCNKRPEVQPHFGADFNKQLDFSIFKLKASLDSIVELDLQSYSIEQVH